jgi:hypothetical protein
MGTTLSLTIESPRAKAEIYDLLLKCTLRLETFNVDGPYKCFNSPPDQINLSRFGIIIHSASEYDREVFGANYGLKPTFEIDFHRLSGVQWDLAMLEVAQITKMIFTEYLISGIIGFDYGTMFLWRSPEGLWTSPTDKPPAAFMEVFKGLTLERDIPQM